MLAQARERGLVVKVGFEWEFYVIDQPLAEIARAGFPVEMRVNHTRPYTYHGLRITEDRELLESYVLPLEASGLELESLGCETGAGQYELNLRFDEALRTADKAFLMKQAVKTIASRQGRTATFMAKPHETWSGNSGHLHLSLWRRDADENLLHFWTRRTQRSTMGASRAVAGVSRRCRGGPVLLSEPEQLQAARPVHVGVDDEDLGPREPDRRPARDRVRARRLADRARMPGGDCNPYLAIAAAVAGMLHGIDQGSSRRTASTATRTPTGRSSSCR